MPAENLSLYRIDDTLAQLFALREELAADGAPAEELAVIDQQLREYQAMVPKKVEGVAAIYRQWRAVRSEVKAERERLAGIEKALEAREERLKAYLAEILEKQPLPAKGCRKLVGASGSQLMLKGNGGVEPLEIADESMLSDEMCRMEGWISAELLKDLLDMEMRLPIPPVVDSLQFHFARVPDTKRIREALAQPCAVCCADRQVLCENPALGDDAKVQCSACGGSGRQGVPGAHLLPRGQHVEIK